MVKQTIQGTDYVSDALLTKSQGNDDELYVTTAAHTTEIEAGRDGESSLLAKNQAQDVAIAALAAGSGVVVSSNDTTSGFLNGKLVTGYGIDFTENNDGGSETLTVKINQPKMFFFATM